MFALLDGDGALAVCLTLAENLAWSEDHEGRSLIGHPVDPEVFDGAPELS